MNPDIAQSEAVLEFILLSSQPTRKRSSFEPFSRKPLLLTSTCLPFLVPISLRASTSQN